MTSKRFAGLVVVLALLANDQALAESKWSFKKLIPSFGKSESPPSGLYSKSKEPSIWTKMNSSGKRMVAKTKEAVPDWLMPETQDRVRKSSEAVKSSTERVKGEVRTARRNIFAPWSAPDNEEDSRPKTASDFIGQDRPE